MVIFLVTSFSTKSGRIRTVLLVSQESYVEFLALLDAPAEPNERLRKTMRAKTLWG
jgi:uncharacterized protein (DUF1778 family)